MIHPPARKKLLLALLVLLISALACQTVANGLDRATATSALDPVPTKTPIPPESNTDPTPEQATPQTEALPTPTIAPISMEMQKDIFQELWEIVRDEYLYEDYNGIDWDATYREYNRKIENGMDTAEFYIAMDEMIFQLGDEHSIYLSPQMVAAEELEYAGDHDYVGVGIWVQYVPERERAVILLTFPGGPAEEAGIQGRDFILSVEGQPLNDEDGAALDLLLGVEGTPITFTVQTPGEAPRTLTINRSRITGTLPVPYEVLTTPAGKRIAYIVLPTFSDSSIGSQVGDALNEMTRDAPLDGIILDNRINGGGYDNVMSSTLSYFTNGMVGHFTNRAGREALRVPRKNVGGSAKLPLVVLVGPDTVSFGEIFSGILKDQGRATLIGETTNGNVEILWGYNFDDGSRAWIAHDTFKPAKDPDVDWEHEGITVDIEAPAAWDQYTTESDPAIQAALDYFDQ